jgi:hypothetical protein
MSNVPAHNPQSRSGGQLLQTGVAVEKLFPAKFAKTKLRQDDL